MSRGRSTAHPGSSTAVGWTPGSRRARADGARRAAGRGRRPDRPRPAGPAPGTASTSAGAHEQGSRAARRRLLRDSGDRSGTRDREDRRPPGCGSPRRRGPGPLRPGPPPARRARPAGSPRRYLPWPGAAASNRWMIDAGDVHRLVGVDQAALELAEDQRVAELLAGLVDDGHHAAGRSAASTSSRFLLSSRVASSCRRRRAISFSSSAWPARRACPGRARGGPR